MAQGTHTHHEAEISADQAAWNATAARRATALHNGQVEAHSGDMIFPLPPLTGFASLPDNVRDLVFEALAYWVPVRIGQRATGNVAEVVAATMNGAAKIPNSRNSDARESVYRDTIRAALKARRPDLFKKDLSGDEKARAIKTIERNIDDYREKHFARIVEAAIARGLNRPGAEKAKRVSKAGVEGESIEHLL